MARISGLKTGANNAITAAYGLHSFAFTCESAFVHKSCHSIRTKKSEKLLFSNTSKPSLDIGNIIKPKQHVNNVAIIGGGLAGLSVAYHLLDMKQMCMNEDNDVRNSPLQITIYDKSRVGEGGASAVAGGLQHPFSPKGKLIHFGMEALEQSNRLVQIAKKYQPSCLIKPHLYRLALSEANVKQLQNTAINHPDIAIWMSKEDVNNQLGADALGGLKLHNGCQVIDVPLYLMGLWEACKTKATECKGDLIWEQKQMKGGDAFNEHILDKHNVVIMAAGSGIIQDKLLSIGGDDDTLPVQLVRGQSVIMGLSAESSSSVPTNEALLCGKYISPVPSNTAWNNYGGTEPNGRQFVIGATHEFKREKMNESQVVEELKSRSYQLAPDLWDFAVVNCIISGVRMQSNCGNYGRMPIIGKMDMDVSDKNKSKWIFTGLSSRGLIYHGLFGQWLADAVLRNDETVLRSRFEEFDWWKKVLKG